MNSTLRSHLEYNLFQNIYYQDRVGNKEGYVKIYPNNTYIHEKVKFEIALKLKKEGWKIYTECRFKEHQGRADIIAIKDGVGYIIEVMKSEKDLKHKKFKYPQDFEILEVKTKNFDISTFTL